MRKISLDVEALEVESFATEATENTQEGTVHAHARTYPQYCRNTWDMYGCASVSDEFACVCQPDTQGETCLCIETLVDTCECIP